MKLHKVGLLVFLLAGTVTAASVSRDSRRRQDRGRESK